MFGPIAQRRTVIALLAYHHFVWADRAGRLVDITPHEDDGALLCRWSRRSLVFLPDPMAKLILDNAPLPTKFFVLHPRHAATARQYVNALNSERLRWLYTGTEGYSKRGKLQ